MVPGMGVAKTSTTAVSDHSDSRLDDNLASTFFGWSMALAVIIAVRIVSSFTTSNTPYHKNTQMILCSILVVSSIALAILSWIYLIGSFHFRKAEWVFFLLLWSTQAQTYFQVMVKRISVLDVRRPRPAILRLAIAGIVLAVNITMFSVWLPLKLDHPVEVDDHPPILLFWLPRVEKIMYLLIDVAINCFFLYHVKTNLMGVGFRKYCHLVSYNLKIIGLSVFCDVLLRKFGILRPSRNSTSITFIERSSLRMSIISVDGEVPQQLTKY